MKIKRIYLVRQTDEDPDTSYLGEYTDKLPDDDLLKRGSAFKRPNADHREYKYFIPAEHHQVKELREGFQGSKGVREYLARKECRKVFDMMEALTNGHWYYIGIKAVAEIEYDSPFGLRTETVESIGLWGIEASTSGLSCFNSSFVDDYFGGTKYRKHSKHYKPDDYIKEIEQEELSNLKEQLQDFNPENFGVDLDEVFEESEIETVEA